MILYSGVEGEISNKGESTMRPLFSTGIICILILLSWIPSTAVLAQESQPEAVPLEGSVLATFDGGSLSLLDLDAKAGPARRKPRAAGRNSSRNWP